MNKKLLPAFIVILVFAALFFYLNQKVYVYVEAYKLSRNHRIYNDLTDRRDYLTYNFAKSVSVAKLSRWAKDNNFSSVGSERVFALNLKREKLPVSKNKLAAVFNRFLGISTASATVMTQEKK